LPDLPVRHWVLAVPKRLLYFLQRDADLEGLALRLFLRRVEQCLRAHSPGSGSEARLGAGAFIHRLAALVPPPRLRLDVVADIHRALAGRQKRQRTQCQRYAPQGDRAALAFAGFSGRRATPSKVFQSVAWDAAAAGRFVGAGY